MKNINISIRVMDDDRRNIEVLNADTDMNKNFN